MSINEVKELKRAIVDLHKFCNGGAIREKKGDIDKYGTGFNVDGRRKMKFNKLIVDEGDAWELMRGCDDHRVIGLRLAKKGDADTVMQLFLLLNPYYKDNASNDYYKKALDKYQGYLDRAYQEKDLLLMGINCEGDYYFLGTRNEIIENLQNFGTNGTAKTDKS